MSAEVKKEIQIEIAHVLFIDIVGYSKLLINEQHELLQELNQIVRTTEAFRAAEAVGKLIRLPTGDGAATLHPKIARLVCPAPRLDGAEFVGRLTSACDSSSFDPQALKLLLASFLPEYTPAHTRDGAGLVSVEVA